MLLTCESNMLLVSGVVVGVVDSEPPDNEVPSRAAFCMISPEAQVSVHTACSGVGT